MSLLQTPRKAKKSVDKFPPVLVGASNVRYKKARGEFKRKLRPAALAAVKSEKLSHHDFSIRITAR